ncbi:MAG TPA: PAS domain S-box protein [Accumulibacter sp.]|nr:PAS domain S-box protein [Accumulibacter sp.]
MPASSTFRPRRYRFEWLLLFGALLVLGGVTVIFHLLRVQQLEREDGAQLQDAAREMAERSTRRLHAATQGLRMVASDVLYWAGSGKNRGEPRLAGLASLLDGADKALTVLILDRSGRVTAASRRELLGRDFSERMYFLAATRRSAPAGDDVATLDANAVVLTRAVVDRRGALLAVVAIELPPEYLGATFEAAGHAPLCVSLGIGAHRVSWRLLPGVATSGGAVAPDGGRSLCRMVDDGASAFEGGIVAVRELSLPGVAMDGPLRLSVREARPSSGGDGFRDAIKVAGLFLALALSSSVGLHLLQRWRRRLDASVAERAVERRLVAERLQLAVDATGLGVWDYEPASGRLNWDASMYAIHGLDPATGTVGPEDWRRCVLPDDRPSVEAALRSAVDEQRQFRVNFRIRRGDGQIRMLSALARPVGFDGRLPTRIVGINEDITDIWRAEEAVHASEARLKAIFDVLPIGIAVTDAAGTIVECNAAFAMQRGAERERLLGSADAAYVAGARRPDGGAIARDAYPPLRALTAGSAVFDVEMIVDTPEGDRWLSVSALPIGAAARHTQTPADATTPAEASSETRGVVVASVDVGASRRGEAALRTLSRAVEQSATAVLITNADGVIEFVNSATCELHGYPAAALLGASPRLFKSERTPPETYSTMWSTLRAGRVWRGELVNRRRDGQLIDVAVSIAPVTDNGGAITHFVAIEDDVSARHAAERLHDELRARLSRVERMQVIGALAGGVASDFNNILVAILGFSGLGKAVLQAAGGPARVLSYFEEIETAGERAKDLVAQLLTFASGGTSKRATVRVADMLREVAETVEASLPSFLTLAVDSADDLPSLEIDRSHLYRLLTALCRNARDAMHQPGIIRIVARAVFVEAGHVCASCHGEFSGEFLRIAVIDGGSGIPERLREHIFEPFFTTKDVAAGAGMGLPVVHGLTHVYGGHLQVGNAVDRGTEVAILLPRAISSTEAARPPS